MGIGSGIAVSTPPYTNRGNPHHKQGQSPVSRESTQAEPAADFSMENEDSSI